MKKWLNKILRPKDIFSYSNIVQIPIRTDLSVAKELFFIVNNQKFMISSMDFERIFGRGRLRDTQIKLSKSHFAGATRYIMYKSFNDYYITGEGRSLKIVEFDFIKLKRVFGFKEDLSEYVMYIQIL